MTMKADIGIIGLGLMGENLAINIEGHGYSVAGFDVDIKKCQSFAKRTKGLRTITSENIKDFINSLNIPKKILMMVPAGKTVDQVINDLKQYLSPGDVLIDGGNSHFSDTERRMKSLEGMGVYYVGMGVSGGEEGALKGPSIMPGGDVRAWPLIGQIFKSIAAKTESGDVCCDWIETGGAGHFVKMVHNGIEYGDMQLISEAYFIMKELLVMNADEMSEVFKDWNKGELNSYLIEITGDILAYKDVDGKPLVDKILDTAGQKGTGKWASVTALDLGVPLTLISEAVYARCVSAIKDERILASKQIKGPSVHFKGNKKEFVEELRKALYASKIVSYAQGFSLLRTAAEEFRWNLNYSKIAMLWRGGCIIRSIFLEKIKEAYEKEPKLSNLLLSPFFKEKIETSQEAWRNVVSTAVVNGIWIPAFSSSLNYFDGYRSSRLPANLLQAQRDYFGAHQYERIDKPRGEFFHTNWTGHGGEKASTVYNV